jgi:predicted AAA+ superfamily ATPase
MPYLSILYKYLLTSKEGLNKEIYYYLNKTECNFVIKKDLTITEVIQVSFSLSNPNTKKREVMGLLNAMKTYNFDCGLILTQDEEYEEIISNKKITIMPVWKWLLNETQ